MEYNNFSNYNDYELLYYARDYNEEAYNILFWKYSFLINSKIKKFNVPYLYKEDFYQEGCIILHKAIRIFDCESKMRFTTFFELLLTRHYINLMTKLGKTFRNDLKESLDDYSYTEETNDIYLLKEESYNFSELESLVYNLYFIKTWNIEDIVKEFNIEPKSLYNTKQRVAKKIREKYKA